ncbi:Uma2 family endonuclease [candidate division KSB1 bacterium]|nr:Uma2 family endonuclease [candidate division KSB1 bacterium]
MQQAARKYLTPEEYLALEDAAEYKSEYYKGETFAMARGSDEHNTIALNLVEGLRSSLRSKNCKLFMSDMKVWIEKVETFAYPDLAVVCGAPNYYQGRRDIITNPLVLIEVLSESTKNYDRGEKFQLYRSLPSLREYILIDQTALHVEQYYREAKFRWILTEHFGNDEILKLGSVEAELTLRAIYDSVEFNPSDKK